MNKARNLTINVSISLTASMDSTIEQLADEWLRLDGDPQTRGEIQKLLERNDLPELEKRLKKRIGFGTAGLRGTMQAGFSAMNSLTVVQTSQGLAEYLLATQENVRSRGVVVGRDARHHSKDFARLSASVFAAKGIRVWWFAEVAHTPLVPFGVCELGAAAGIMITASHNPPQDNGYKVYWENGCQITSPHDSGISAAIDANLDPIISVDPKLTSDHTAQFESVDAQVSGSYFRIVNHIMGKDFESSISHVPRFAYTPMHGVGLPAMTKAMQDLGLVGQMKVVPSQAEPDPDFPTVKFPNPEEKGALDEAIKVADENAINIILANDPDADRFAAAEKVDGSWYQFTGNEIGALLASYVLSKYDSPEKRKRLVMLSSTVSSRMLSAMAKSEGFQYIETLTGFKWLGNRAKDLLKEGLEPAFAFEEALGYMFPDIVPDKDGISAAAQFLVAASHWAAHGNSPYAELQKLYSKYGYFAGANTYLLCPPQNTAAIFERIVSLERPYPQHVGQQKVAYWRDLTRGYDSATANNVPLLPVSSSSQMLTAELENGVRFTVRGSGTEPKIKIYVEARGESMKEAKAKAVTAQRDIIREWFPLDEFGLTIP